MMVAIAVMMLRNSEPNRPRSFKTPALWLVGPATIAGCIFLFFNLPFEAMLVLPAWGALGMVIYFAYSYRASHVGRGIVEAPVDLPLA
jgi:APA family basic amino acid/polyamine antiporter